MVFFMECLVFSDPEAILASLGVPLIAEYPAGKYTGQHLEAMTNWEIRCDMMGQNDLRVINHFYSYSYIFFWR